MRVLLPGLITDDHVLDASVEFGVIPKKYLDAKLSHLDTSFAMGRGRQRDGVDLPAQEMQSALISVCPTCLGKPH